MSNMIIENPELISELALKMEHFAHVFTGLMRDREQAVQDTLNQISNIESGCEAEIKSLEQEIRELEQNDPKDENEKRSRYEELESLKQKKDDYKIQASYCRRFQSELETKCNSVSNIVGLERRMETHFSKFPKGIAALGSFFQIMNLYLQCGPGSSPMLEQANSNQDGFGQQIGRFDSKKLSNNFGDAKIFKMPDNQSINDYSLNKFEAEAKSAGKEIFVQINSKDVGFMQNRNYHIVKDNNQFIAHKKFD
jgi:hypothetical protein